MVFLLLASAWAADLAVTVDYAFRTPPVVVFSETTPLGTATPTQTRLPPDRYRLNGGLSARLGTRALGRQGTLVFDTGVYAWSAIWYGEPEDFSAAVWEGRLDVGTRWTLRKDRHREDWPVALGYGVVGLGPQLSVFTTPWWPTHVNPALHAFAGLGLSVGGDRVRFQVELRVDAAARADSYQGRAQRPEDQLGWTYYPGRVAVGTQMGLFFPRRAS